MPLRCPLLAGAVAVVAIGFSSLVLAGDPAPDVIVSTIGPGLAKNGNVGGVNGITGYSSTTVSCNIGDADAIWIDCTNGGPNCNKHPVIGQQMYRLKDGRMEQIGMSWLKHGFCAADSGTVNCGTPWVIDGSCDWLGLHATDTYDTNLNGMQTGLGPRSEVNPYTGAFAYPYVLNWNITGNATFKRLQIHNDDLSPALNPGAQYFIEVVYITTDEPDVNRYNNTSYRQVNVGTFVSNGYNLSYAGVTNTQQTGLHVWKLNDPANVTETNVDIPNDGRFVVSSKATSLGGGMWHYEYAVLNYNSNRGAQSFAVDLPDGATVSNDGFHDVDYHSGEPYSGTDWTPPAIGATNIAWSTETFDVNVNANAIRWSTCYNFRFDCNRPPKDGEVTIGLFKAGDPAFVTAAARVPDYDCNANDVGDTIDLALGTSLDANRNGVPDECDPPPPRCDGDGQCDDGDPCNGIETCLDGVCQPGTITDCNGNQISDACDISSGSSLDANGNGIPDECDPPPPTCVADISGNGVVDVDDLLIVINTWGQTGKEVPADLDGSGIVDVDDLLIVINAWGPCPI